MSQALLPKRRRRGCEYLSVKKFPGNVESIFGSLTWRFERLKLLLLRDKQSGVKQACSFHKFKMELEIQGS